MPIFQRIDRGPRHYKRFTKPSRTHQSFKDECDINKLMAKYKKSGLITHLERREARFGDFIDAPDYRDAMNQIIEAQEAFMTLSAAVRRRFGNDPAEFLEFAQNPDNAQELVDLGLAVKAPTEPPQGSPDPSAVPPPTPAAEPPEAP